MLVYGKEARLLLSVELSALDIVHQLQMFEGEDLMSIRYAKLMELEESRRKAMETMEYHQLQMKRVFDKKAFSKLFVE